jgi:colanic acid/amylovoran biosynthesis glycosyltransferase
VTNTATAGPAGVQPTSTRAGTRPAAGVRDVELDELDERSVGTPYDGCTEPVLHFAADWLPASEVFVYDLVRTLRRPAVVLSGNRVCNADRFPWHDLHSLAPLARVRPALLRSFAMERALDVLIRRRGVGLVHVHHGYQVERVLGAVHRHHLPLVLSLHGHDVAGYLDHGPDPYARAAELVSAVVVPSRFMVDHAVAAGFDPQLVRVLPSGVDTSFFTPTPLPDGPPTAVFVGRFVAKKGIDVLAEAWPAVQRAVPAARLRILGFGELEGLARSIEGQVDVELLPGREAVRSALRDARVVVTPSHRAADDVFESLLMVNLEAQASGRPVVTTRHGGVPEYVREGETALVVPEAQPRPLAEALILVLRDHGLATRLGNAGPGAVAALDVERAARRMDSLYHELTRVTVGT